MFAKKRSQAELELRSTNQKKIKLLMENLIEGMYTLELVFIIETAEGKQEQHIQYFWVGSGIEHPDEDDICFKVVTQKWLPGMEVKKTEMFYERKARGVLTYFLEKMIYGDEGFIGLLVEIDEDRLGRPYIPDVDTMVWPIYKLKRERAKSANLEERGNNDLKWVLYQEPC